MAHVIAYIGLGSNQDKPLKQLKTAIRALSIIPDISVEKVSAFYQSKAITLPGSQPQADYINAVMKITTRFNAPELLERLQQIETQQGRQRLEKWAARTLDLDILLYDNEIINNNHLKIPHGQMTLRNFVIFPLYEIAGDITIPKAGLLSTIASKLSWQGLTRLTSEEAE